MNQTDRASAYDRIGVGYSHGRRSDPAWAAAVEEALGGAAIVVNVGAGTGSYESARRRIVAVEPSPLMLAQRASDAAPAVRGVAERLPIADGAAGAALAVLTVHHWDDWRAGIDELCRVAPRRVVVTYDPVVHAEQWIVRDYVPEIATLDDARPSLDDVVRRLDARVLPLPLARDFSDGVLGAFWCRPRRYLDPATRRHMSGFARVDPAAVARGMAKLADDLASGAWAERNRALVDAGTFDAGFRLLVSDGRS